MKEVEDLEVVAMETEGGDWGEEGSEREDKGTEDKEEGTLEEESHAQLDMQVGKAEEGRKSA